MNVETFKGQSFEILSNSADPRLTGNGHPEEQMVCLARVGEWKGRPNPYRLSADDIATLHRHFQDVYVANKAELVCDYDHQTGEAAEHGIQAPAAGWLRQTEIRNTATGPELWGLARWTDRARAYFANREYRYISPVYLRNARHPATGERYAFGLGPIAVTNFPFIRELPAIANSQGVASADNPLAGQQEEKEEPMPLLNSLAQALGQKPEQTAQAIGVAADAADDAVLAGVAATLKANGETLANRAAETEQLKNSAAGLKARADGLTVVANALGMAPDSDAAAITAEIGKRAERETESKADVLVNSAVAAGKIPPANADWWKKQAKADLDGTERIVNSMPKLIGEGSSLSGKEPPKVVTDEDLDPAKAEETFKNSAALQDEFLTADAFKAYCEGVKTGTIRRKDRK